MGIQVEIVSSASNIPSSNQTVFASSRTADHGNETPCVHTCHVSARNTSPPSKITSQARGVPFAPVPLPAAKFSLVSRLATLSAFCLAYFSDFFSLTCAGAASPSPYIGASLACITNPPWSFTESYPFFQRSLFRPLGLLSLPARPNFGPPFLHFHF